MAGEGVGLGAEAPDVEVVDVDDAGDLFHRGAEICQVEVAGCAFEQDVEGFADDADRTPEDHGGDDEREQGVDPLEAR